MSNLKNRIAAAFTLLLIMPFAAGIVHAADPAKPATDKMSTTAPDKPLSPPTIDTDKDGTADAWDRDANGVPDAWDLNGDGKPDVLDNNGDGKPDEEKAPPPLAEPEGAPEEL
jgi:hypothetical protein